MTKLTKILPNPTDIAPDAVVTEARHAALKPLPTGSPEAKAYCATLSKLLLTDPRAQPYPELQALGFWLRPAAIENMVREYLGTSAGPSKAATGIVFQLPPGNVVTLFGYTSSVSLLCGNVTIIRLPSAEHPVQVLLTILIEDSLKQAPATLRNRLIVLRYNHDDAITEQISSISNVRLVWGSDKTVEHIQNLSLPSTSEHVSFGDRFSAMAINVEAYATLDENGRTALIKNVFNDIYLFDQLACSSPRLLVWVGNEETTRVAADDFYSRLGAYATSRGYQADISGYLAKLNTSYLALHDLAPTSYKTYSPSLSVITLPDLTKLSPFKSVNYGYGTLLAVRLKQLVDLVPYTETHDQTLGVFGFDKTETQAFAEQCKERGFKRIVPVGQALTFHPIWDGYNLFDVMTRPIEVKS